MTLLEPIVLKNLVFSNRVAVAPMSRMQASPDGIPSEDAAEYYARYARHGASLIITEAIYTDDSGAKAYINQPGLTCQDHVQGWQDVTKTVRSNGGKIFAQLQHAGKLAEPSLHSRVLGPVDGSAAGSTWQTNSAHAYAHAVTEKEIHQIAKGFARAAEYAMEAGFDGIEIHGARGYLINDFLSAYNTRQDRWGGELENRIRFPMLVVEKVRDAIGTSPISFNYSIYKMDEYKYQPPGSESEVAYVLESLRRAGVDILHISTRRLLHHREGQLDLSRIANKHAPGFLIVNGGLTNLDDCEDALSKANANMVSLARSFLANPDWLKRTLAGSDLASYVPGMERQPLLQEYDW